MPSIEIRYFDKDRPAPVDLLVDLHRSYLPDSLVCRLGPYFMRRFFYSALVEAGLLFGVAAYVGGRPAGMITGVVDSSRFMKKGARAKPIAFAAGMAGAAFGNPRSFITLLSESRQLYDSRSRETVESGLGEVPTCVVPDEFSSKEFQTKLRGPLSLYLTAKLLDMFLARGVFHLRAMVKPENGRMSSRMRDAGWRTLPGNAEGWRIPLQEMRLDIRDRLPYYMEVVRKIEVGE